jgi:hypothetical protein
MLYLVDLGRICSFFQGSIAVLVECTVNELAIVWNLCFAFGLMAVTGVRHVTYDEGVDHIRAYILDTKRCKSAIKKYGDDVEL